MENHMEKTLENDMGTVFIEGFWGYLLILWTEIPVVIAKRGTSYRPHSKTGDYSGPRGS